MVRLAQLFFDSQCIYYNNVWQWLWEQSAFQLLSKSRQRIVSEQNSELVSKRIRRSRNILTLYTFTLYKLIYKQTSKRVPHSCLFSPGVGRQWNERRRCTEEERTSQTASPVQHDHKSSEVEDIYEWRIRLVIVELSSECVDQWVYVSVWRLSWSSAIFRWPQNCVLNLKN